MSRRILDLSTAAWQFGRAPRQPWSANPRDDRASVSEWLPAKVPGDVRADLIAAARIPPVETPEGIAAGAWVDDWDWWYRVEVPGGNSAAEAVILEADGIDYYCAVWLDGRLLATHAGMFARQAIALSPYINQPGPHQLAIRLWGGGVFAAAPSSPLRRATHRLSRQLGPGTELFSERMATPKAQFSFGWDFSPRLLSTGIWDDIRLVTARGVYIENMWVEGNPLTPSDDPTPAQWRVRLRLHRWQTGPVQIEITLRPENFEDAGYQTLSRTVELCPDYRPPCTGEYEFHLDTVAARRWWPWDQGMPCLYRVSVRLADGAGVLDEISETVGLRSVRRTRLPAAVGPGAAPDAAREATAPWQFVINGRPVFLRGANWAPADVLPGRVQDAQYSHLLTMARTAGVNFLRVWGGGLREKRAFWDWCDHLGIMAWQEFPLSYDFLDDYSRDAGYLATLGSEARGTVEALRNRPSLIAWCGGNEINPERERAALAQIADAVKAGDRGRPWIPASPGAGDVHQWDVWHGRAPWTDLADEKAAFLSEFGLQALPCAETLDEMFPAGAPASLSDRRWKERKAQPGKLRHYAGADARSALPAAIRATQQVQATALQVGLEAARRRRWSNNLADGGEIEGTCGGVCLWQWNEPWPAVSWAVIDRAGRPKAAYEMLCRSFQPVLIAATFPWRAYATGDTLAADLWIVNDGVETWDECCVGADLDGYPVWGREGVTVRPTGSRRIGRFEHTLTRSPATLTLNLVRAGVPLATNRYDLTVPLPPKRPLAARLVRSVVRRLPE